MAELILFCLRLMRNTRRIILLLPLLTLPVLPAGEARAKNVILFLADGGGIPTVNAASLHGYGKPQALYVQQMPYIGLSDTSSASNWVTDSAAGMTAIVTGQKTNNGVISQSAAAVRGRRDGETLKTILEYAEERGLSTGVLTDRPISDATPAACYAHNNDRSKQGEIFLQILKPRFGDGPDLVVGLGRGVVEKQTAALGMDIWPELAAKGYQRVTSPESCRGAQPRAARLVALFESEEFKLAEWVDCALTVLSRNPKGFFLMVELDTHLGEARKSLEAMIELDRIVRRTAERMKGADTLILFTADHSYDLHLPRSGVPGEDIVPLMKLAGHHNAEEVLVAAEGPGAERVRGFIPNTWLFQIMMSAYGWK
ncbi:MAG: alkaline phosphatase [Acidobacteria bacterium]|nr:alkaline phosphatase [Acidobacteriota bacterium]